MMNFKPIILTTLLFLTACQTQAVPLTSSPTLLPTETSLPTATATFAPTETPLPTETPSQIATPSDVFAAIPLNSVQAFNIEPVVEAIFEQGLQEYINAGSIHEYRVDSISVFPSGEGTLIAEIMYSLRTDNDPWVEDFGAPGADGWITGKCSRFDLVATETEHQLKNKRLCG